MKIILGVFSESYRNLQKEHGLTSYGGFTFEPIDVNEHYKEQTDYCACVIADTLKTIHYNILMCEEIFFDLTHITLDITDQSFQRYTINELLLVLTDSSYFAKTRFFNNGEEMSKNEVFNWFIFHPYWNQFLQ